MKSSLVRSVATLGVATVIYGTMIHVDVAAQEIRVEDSAVTLSSNAEGRAELWLEFDDGSEQRIVFADGEFHVNGEALPEVGWDDRVVDSWRELLSELAGEDNATVERRLVAYAERSTDGEGDLGRQFGRKLLEILRDALEDRAELDTPSTITGPGGSRLAIAPGGVEFDELLGQLDRLRDGLGQLGGAAGETTDALALIVHDDFAIDLDEVIDGNLALLEGSLELAGTVSGNVLVLDGELVLADGARIEGDILQVGGDLEFRGEALAVEGEIVSDFPSAGGAAAAAAVETTREVSSVRQRTGSGRNVRSNPVRSFARNLGHAAEELMGAITTLITLGAIGLVLVYFFQGRVEMVTDTVRHEFGRSFAMGLAAEVLFFPALLILCVLVITWPIVPFFVLGTGLAMLAGYLAVAHGAGEMFAQRRYRYEWLERLRRSNSYYYMLSGLVLLLLPFAATAVLWVLGGTAGFVRGIVAFLAAIGTWILMTAGFGSVLLTRAGSRSVVVDWSEGPGATDYAGTADTDVEPAPEAPEPGAVDEPEPEAGGTDA